MWFEWSVQFILLTVVSLKQHGEKKLLTTKQYLKWNFCFYYKFIVPLLALQENILSQCWLFRSSFVFWSQHCLGHIKLELMSESFSFDPSKEIYYFKSCIMYVLFDWVFSYLFFKISSEEHFNLASFIYLIWSHLR